MLRLVSVFLICLALNSARADISIISNEESKCDLFSELSYTNDAGEQKCVAITALNMDAEDLGVPALLGSNSN